MDLALRVAALLFPLLLGVAAGAARLFEEPQEAIRHLNRYALTFAFPALVFRGLLDAEFSVPTSPLFWLAVPGVLAFSLLISRALARALGRPEWAGTAAMIESFGNVAYLGLPIVAQVLGSAAVGVSSLAVAVHITLAMAVGPVLLLRWGGGTGAVPLAGLARQPLLWAPVVGLAARALPSAWGDAALVVVGPLGGSAAPVALFLLGVYLHRHRRGLRFGKRALYHVFAKQILLPGVTFALAFVGVQQGWIARLDAQVLVVLAAMPAAITTFAIAERYHVGVETISEAIVVTTALAAAGVPAAVMLAQLL